MGGLAKSVDVHIAPWLVGEWSAFAPGNTSQDLTMPMRLGEEAMVVAIGQNVPAATIDRAAAPLEGEKGGIPGCPS